MSGSQLAQHNWRSALHCIGIGVRVKPVIRVRSYVSAVLVLLCARAGAQVRAAVDGARWRRARGERGLAGLVRVHHEPRRLRGRQARRARPPRVYAYCSPDAQPTLLQSLVHFHVHVLITCAVLTCSGLEMELAENIYTRAQPGAFLPCAYINLHNCTRRSRAFFESSRSRVRVQESTWLHLRWNWNDRRSTGRALNCWAVEHCTHTADVQELRVRRSTRRASCRALSTRRSSPAATRRASTLLVLLACLVLRSSGEQTRPERWLALLLLVGTICSSRRWSRRTSPRRFSTASSTAAVASTSRRESASCTHWNCMLRAQIPLPSLIRSYNYLLT